MRVGPRAGVLHAAGAAPGGGLSADPPPVDVVEVGEVPAADVGRTDRHVVADEGPAPLVGGAVGVGAVHHTAGKKSTSPGSSSSPTGSWPTGGATKSSTKLELRSAWSGHSRSIRCVPGQTWSPPLPGYRFLDPLHFSRRFRQLSGRPPSQARKAGAPPLLSPPLLPQPVKGPP